MTQEQFIFSLRGTNGEGDPPREALVEVYNSIQAKELKVLLPTLNNNNNNIILIINHHPLPLLPKEIK